MVIIQLKDVWKEYQANSNSPIFALKEINLEVEYKQRIFITGHSGAGKSTLFKLIGCFERPTKGEIIVSGQQLKKLNTTTLSSYRQQIAYVPQAPVLLNNYTVMDNILLGLQTLKLSYKEALSRAETTLREVEMLKFSQSVPYSLSIGEQQRVALARAMARRPNIVLADEPTGNLDPNLSKSVMSLLFSMNEQRGTTLLIATHEQSMVNELFTKQRFTHISLKHGSVDSMAHG